MAPSIETDQAPEEEEKEPATANIHMPKNARPDVTIEGFSTAEVGKKAKIIIEGSVAEVSDRDKRWDSGKRIELEDVTKIIIEGPGKAMSISEALEEAGVKV